MSWGRGNGLGNWVGNGLRNEEWLGNGWRINRLRKRE